MMFHDYVGTPCYSGTKWITIRNYKQMMIIGVNAKQNIAYSKCNRNVIYNPPEMNGNEKRILLVSDNGAFIAAARRVLFWLVKNKNSGG